MEAWPGRRLRIARRQCCKYLRCEVGGKGMSFAQADSLVALASPPTLLSCGKPAPEGRLKIAQPFKAGVAAALG